MPSVDTFRNAVWLIGTALQFFLLWQIVRRGVYRSFPFFSTYIAAVCVKDLGLTLVYWAYHPAYSWAYWGGEVVTIVLSLAVMEEILRHALLPFEQIKSLGFKLFAAAVVLAIGIAAASALAPSQDSNWFAVSMLVLERGVRVLQIVLLLFLIGFSSLLRISWADRSFGIMLGFSTFAIIELTTVAMRASMGDVGQSLYNILKPLGFVFALSVWNHYVRQPESAVVVVAASESVPVPAWNQGLEEYLKQ